MKLRYLATFALLLVACSRQAEQAAPEPAPTRASTENAFVQKDNTGAADAARKVSREEALKQLADLVAKLEKTTSVPDSFKYAEAIENLGRDIRPELEAAIPKLPELPRIAALRALWTLEGWDPAVEGLLAIVTGAGELDTRVTAGEVISAIASPRHAKMLGDALKDKVFDPPVRVQLAIALWLTAKDTAATKALRDLLSSENESFRIQAALALGQIHQVTSDSRPILEQLAEEPTIRGRTARRILDYENAFKRLEAAMMGKYPGDKPPPERIDIRLLDNLQFMIQERFIYPEVVAGRKLLYAAMNGMLDGLDPYTCMLEDSQLRDAGEIARFAVPSLGLILGSARLDPKPESKRQLRLTRVLSVVAGSPADLAGIQPGDRIYRVVRGATEKNIHDLRAGKRDLPEEDKPFQLIPLDDQVTQLQGALGTTIGLQTMRDGWLLARWIHLTHAEINVDPVAQEMLPGGIGMIHIADLGAAAPAQVKEALAELAKSKAKAVILDLRNAAGGSVEAATQVAAQFLPKGTLVTYSKGRSAELAPRKDYITATEGDIKTPLVVLVNGGTADAAEVLAGALKAQKRARIAGTRTFGRAIVQELIPLSAGELKEDNKEMALLLTVARFHDPVSEQPWYDRGLEPDTELKPRLFEGWIYDEVETATESPVFAAYMDGLNKEPGLEKLKELAKADGRNTTAWPGLDDLYSKLNLHISKEDLRYAVRAEVRRKLADQIPKVDLQEDSVFTGAVKEAAKAAGINLSEIPEYSTISK